MLQTVFLDHAWAAILFYVALAMLDYRLSVIGRRWFHRGACEHYDLGGSYELNPPFEADIEAEKPVSIRHLAHLALNSVILLVVWWLTARVGDFEGIYLALLGFFVLVQVPVHVRHVNNILLFRTVATRGGVSGKSSTERWLDLRLSGTLFWVFAVVWGVVFALTFEWFFVGGVVGSLLVGARFWIFGDEAAEPETAPESGEEPAI